VIDDYAVLVAIMDLAAAEGRVRLRRDSDAEITARKNVAVLERPAPLVKYANAVESAVAYFAGAEGGVAPVGNVNTVRGCGNVAPLERPATLLGYMNA
jgi:hypothetical protein